MPETVPLAPDALAEIDALRKDFEVFAPRCLRVEPEEGRAEVPFALNRTQRLVRWATRHVRRLVILKGRGMGITTEALGERFHGIWSTYHWKAGFFAHTDKDTRSIFRRVTTWEDGLHPQLRHHRPSNNSHELYYPALGSSLGIWTIGGKGPARGSRMQDVHVSELAYAEVALPQQRRFLAGLTEAARAGRVVVESTANGVGNLYHELWQDAADWAHRAGLGGLATGRITPDLVRRLRAHKDVARGAQWVPLFLPWWLDERNQIALDPEERAAFTLTAEEAAWAAPHRVPTEAVAWRREKAKTLRTLVDQEYPNTAESAFLVSGDLFFDPKRLIEMQHAAPAPIAERDDGMIVEWEAPVEGADYLIAADPSDGSPKGDFAYGSVHRRDAGGRQVARICGRLAPRVFARMLAELGHRYNLAEIGPERNHRECLRRLMEDHGYPRLFRRIDPITGHLDPEPGWPTLGNTRTLALDGLKGALEGDGQEPGWLVVRDPLFCSQGLAFTRSKAGRYEAKSGDHDDAIIAVAIAVQMLQSPTPRITF